jgi:hypothetical protein
MALGRNLGQRLLRQSGPISGYRHSGSLAHPLCRTVEVSVNGHCKFNPRGLPGHINRGGVANPASSEPCPDAGGLQGLPEPLDEIADYVFIKT